MYLNTVYLIQCGDFPYYKIGVTKNLLARISDLEIGSPLDLTLISSAQIEDAYIVEQALHRKFWNLRIKGEWFKFTKKEISYVKNVLDTLNKKTETEKKYGL